MPKLPCNLPPTAVTGPSAPLGRRLTALSTLLGLLYPVPSEWLSSSSKPRATGPAGQGQAAMGCLPCSSYSVLTTAWKKAMRWTMGLDHALSVMLASVASTKTVGDQLWVKVIGPAACGKSTLCEALSINQDYVFAKSTIRGFLSGYRKDGGKDKEDNSLIPLVRDKTLVTKDGDTLLNLPNLGQILSEARDLYDGTSRSHYRNAMGNDYAGVRMTWLLCGTSSLRAIDSSELGERFLDCVIMEGIDDELEDEILWRVVNRADRNLAIESDGEPGTQYEPELVEAMQLTGGYVSYLRENAVSVLPAIENPRWALRQCARLGKLVAYMRARPSQRQDEGAEREFAPRLVSQHVRLAKCLAMVLNRKSVDEKVMRRVRRVSLDTSRGQTLAIAHCLHKSSDGSEVKALSAFTNQPEEKIRTLLRFLRQIGVVEPFNVKTVGVSYRVRWRLTRRLRLLYNSVMEEGKQCPRSLVQGK